MKLELLSQRLTIILICACALVIGLQHYALQKARQRQRELVAQNAQLTFSFSAAKHAADMLQRDALVWEAKANAAKIQLERSRQ